MSGRHKWDDIVAKRYPEVINARFPKGTKERIKAVADRTMMELVEADRGGDLEQVPILLSPSVIVRRAVMEYLEREEATSDPTDRSS